MAVVTLAALTSDGARGGETPKARDLSEKSLPLRTALHRNPTLGAPLERLLDLYRKVGRVDELVALYRSHVAQYPRDWRGATVLIRLLRAVGDPEAGSRSAAAVQQFPDNAYLHYLRYRVLRASQAPRALEELDKAVALEQVATRRRAWLEELIPRAVAEDRRELAEKHLKALAADATERPKTALDVARVMLRFRFHRLALATLEAAAVAEPPPELRVAIAMAAADAEVGLDRPEAAAARLDRLLDRLTPDYWRRPEVLRRRIALVSSEAERKRMLAAARQRVQARPRDEAAVLDLAQLLVGFQLRREALDVLRKASRRLPDSMPIERRILDLYGRLRDPRGRADYLAERLKLHPDRKGLALRYAKALFALGRRDAAQAQLDRLLADLTEAERAHRLLEVARYLRRASLTADAAGVFEQVGALAPRRIDVRRELAETYLAVGQRRKARDLFAQGFPSDVPLESLLDVVPFLIEQKMYREAEAALAAKVQDAPTHLDLRLLLISIEARVANQASGEGLILETRAIADTRPRYRRWLEGAIAFHDTFDTVLEFLGEELTRLNAEREGWKAAPLERRLVFADVAAQTEFRQQAADMLRGDLEGDPPPAVRSRLRRQLIATLQQIRETDAPIEEHLRKLAAEAPQAADECNARLALLHDRTGRHHLIPPLLEKIDFGAIADTDLLANLEKLYARQGNGEAVLALLRRLTVLAPSNRGHWGRWLEALAAAGDETRLRGAIRRLLAGIERMPLADETRTLLQAHLLDSHWRSVAALAGDGQQAALADALPVIDAAERAARDRRQWLWAAWSRAHILNRLGRTEARDEAIAELQRVVRQKPPEPLRKDDEPEDGAEPDDHAEPKAEETPAQGIVFPDGLVLSLEAALSMLRAGPDAEQRAPTDRRGPMPPLTARWAFDTHGAAVTHILPVDDQRTLISDLGGSLYCLETATGKLLWERVRTVQAATAAETAQPSSPHAIRLRTWGGPVHPAMLAAAREEEPKQFLPPQPVADGRGRVYVPNAGRLECLAAEGGILLWRASFGYRGSPSHQVPAVLAFAQDGRVLAFEPLGGMAAALDPETGKLLWEQRLTSDEAETADVTWQRAGASLSGDRFLVYGARVAILDAETGAVHWSLDPSRLRPFPVRLDEPIEDGATISRPARPATRSPAPYTIAHRTGGRYIPMRHPRALAARQQPPAYVNHLGRSPGSWSPTGLTLRRTALAAPAVVWAKADGPRYAAVRSDRLLLFGQRSFAARLDLPVAAKPMLAGGVFLGTAGGAACFLQRGPKLVAVALESLEGREFGLDEVTGDQVNAAVQAAVDGSLVYVSGPMGVLCLNVRTGQELFAAPWPKPVAPPETPQPPQNVQYLWQGVSTYARNHYGPCMPLAACVQRGLLLTAVTPSRVAALGERANDGR
ncbi:MAG: PQQ-binding-like beta-propeller repeat protein [Planctomycetota bacterium]